MTPYKSIWDETGEAFQRFMAGDLDGASELMGGVGVRVFREGSRIMTFVTLGLTAAQKALGQGVIDDIAENVVRPLARQSNFYVAPNGSVLPANGYRYIGSDVSYFDELIRTGKIPTNAEGTYFSFQRFDVESEAKSILQLLPANRANIRLEFDTLQVAGDARIPFGYYGKGAELEPLTSTFPEFGVGGGTQAVTNSEIRLKRIVDITTGTILKEFD